MIKNIQIGDVILGNGDNNVIGITRSRAPKMLYVYNGVTVSGSHLVLEEGIWKQVKDSKLRKELYNSGHEYLYNLINLFILFIISFKI